MKKLFLVLIVFTFTVSLTNAQVSKDGWAVGVDVVSPRLFGDIAAENLNFGGRLLLQKNLSEHAALRFNLDYLMFTGQNAVKPIDFTNNTIKFGVGAVYNFLPCEEFNPYVGMGGGILYYTLENVAVGGGTKKGSYFGELTADFFFGGLYNFSEDWFLKVELAEVTVSTDKLDGIKAAQGGMFGGTLDSYTSLGIGLLYFFDRGTTSTYCEEMAKGVTANIDYAKVEDIVRKYAATPANVDYNKIEEIVKKNTGSGTVSTKERVITSGNWVLVGVNFESGKSNLSPESYPVLVNAVQVLLSNPDMKVEVQGHTDNIGSDSFNKKLSEQRAETVKRFLVAKGVAASRLSTVGVGSSNPVSDNKTAEGRSLNRRIEFKVLGK